MMTDCFLFTLDLNHTKFFWPSMNFLVQRLICLIIGVAKKLHIREKKTTKLKPIDQLLMSLMKLRLNLKTLDLSFRFGVSKSAVSRYITTWICFL